MKLTKSVHLNHQGINIGEYDFHDENGKLKFQVHSCYGPSQYCATEQRENDFPLIHDVFDDSVKACRYVEALAEQK